MLCLGFSDLASGDRDVRIGLPAIDLAQRDAIPEDPARREEDELLARSDRTGPAQLNRYLLALVVSQNWRRLLHHFIDLHNDRARGRSDLRRVAAWILMTLPLKTNCDGVADSSKLSAAASLG